MKLSLVISVDNDAHDNIDGAADELSEILARYVERIQEGSIALYQKDDYTIYDVNGNGVGQMIVDPYRH